jgi:hypothetical protein
MKLERLNKSIYTHDSLCMNALYFKFKKQMSASIFYNMSMFFDAKMLIVNIRRPILECFYKQIYRFYIGV